MKHKATLALVFFALVFFAGCSDSGTDSKQPKLQGAPDPKIKAPPPKPSLGTTTGVPK
ncbi:MAG: hypothetical protein K8U57_29080 [Planctomycetes bacterium]|nr:hypothetical protein [Planctomycetota bacterium]